MHLFLAILICVVLILIFLIIHYIEHFFVCLFAICVSSLVRRPLASFSRFLFSHTYLFGCTGSWLLRAGSLQLRRAGASLPAAVCGLSPAAASRRLSLGCGVQALSGSAGSRCWGSVAVAGGLGGPRHVESVAGGPGMEPCPLRWKSDSYPLGHEGRPACFLIGLSFSSC